MSSVEPQLTGLLGAVSPLYGLVRARSASAGGAGLPPVAVVSADTAHPLPTLQVDVSFGAGGAAPGYRAAGTSGTGEAIERYSAAFVPYDQLLFGARSGLGVPVTPCPDWALYPSGQSGSPHAGCGDGAAGLANLTDDAPVGWARATRLHDGLAGAVPAQWVYLGYLRGRDEPLLVWTTSTGLACGPDLPTAVLGGLLEVVERDAFMRVWRRRLVLSRVNTDGLVRRHRWLGDALGRPGGPQLSVVDLSPLAVAPTMLAVLRHPHPDMPALAVGAACALTSAAAATKAVIEACHTAGYAAGLRLGELLRERGGGLDEQPCPEPDNFDQHVWQYVEHRRAEQASFLDAGPVEVEVDWTEQPPAADPRAEAERLARDWYAEGVECFAVDVTAPDVADLGLAVARIVSPQAAQLDVAGAGPYLAQPRLQRPTSATDLLDAAALNLDLHPFP